MSFIRWLEELNKHDQSLAGGKAVHLAQLAAVGFAVPASFVVTTKAIEELTNRAGIKALLKRVAQTEPHEYRALNRLAKDMKKAITTSPFPKKLENVIHEAFLRLQRETDKQFFVVRSSTTGEYVQPLSFAGQHRPIFNIGTFSDLKKAVLLSVAGLYQDDSLYYSLIHNVAIKDLHLAVIVQPMLDSEVSGVLMTVNPLLEGHDKMVIEAGWGLGLATSTGEITPDRYEIDKTNYTVRERHIATQRWMLAVRGNVLKHTSVPKTKQAIQKVDDSTLFELASYGRRAEELFGYPQDLEWAIEKEKIWFVHARPIWSGTEASLIPQQSLPAESSDHPETGRVIIRGIPSSVGIESGPVTILHGSIDPDKLPEHSIIVTEIATPALTTIIQKAAGVVTDLGGMTTHAAILAREAGVPCVVGTGEATRLLTDGQVVTVDGFHGVIYQGKVYPSALHDTHRVIPKPSVFPPRSTGVYAPTPSQWITGTKVYLNLAEPNQARQAAELPTDGVGLIRAEFLLSNLGEHPKALIDRGEAESVIRHLIDGLSVIAKSFYPRPVVYRTSDFKTNEYRELKGGETYEPVEPNPTLGYRGVRRYLDDPALFHCELQAIYRLRNEQNLNNIWVIYPFVRTVAELKEAIQMTINSGLTVNRDFKIWMMVETPGNIFAIDAYCQAGINGISIGSNDLTQLILGVDRDNTRLAEYFDERDPAVMAAMIEAVKAARRHHLTASICGNSASIHPEVVSHLIEAGITSVSVMPDVAEETRRLVASIERRILLDKALE